MTGWPTARPRCRRSGSPTRVCGLAGTYATMIALYWRDAAGGGEGQVIDLSLFEPLFSVLGPQITEYHASWAWCRGGRATARREPPRATHTRPPTATGWRSPAARSRS